MTTCLALSVKEAARRAGVGRTVMFEEIRAGRLIAKKVGRRPIVRIEDLAEWLQGLPGCRKRS